MNLGNDFIISDKNRRRRKVLYTTRISDIQLATHLSHFWHVLYNN